MPQFSERSRRRLGTCHPDLQRLFYEVIKHFDCTVIEGKRTKQRQLELMESRVTMTLRSKHVTGDKPSLAVDVAPYPINWEDRERFMFFVGFVLGTAEQMNISIRSGADWDGDRDLKDQSFDDLVHYELEEES